MEQKRVYIMPQVKVLNGDTAEPLAGSVTGDGGIGYGGVDTGGEKDPSANIGVWDEANEKHTPSVWDE